MKTTKIMITMLSVIVMIIPVYTPDDNSYNVNSGDYSTNFTHDVLKNGNLNNGNLVSHENYTVVPNVTLSPILTFDETEGTFTEEEKNNYTQLFDEFLRLQHDRRITNFFYSSNGSSLQKLEISKIVVGAGAFHAGKHVEIWDNGIRAGLSQRKFFFHEMGHLIAFVGHGTCCGGLAEGMAGLTVSEAYKDNPNKLIFNGVVYYTDATFAEQWYKHAEKWNYPIVSNSTNGDMTSESTVREDREFVYIVQTLVYNALLNGASIGNDSTLTNALNDAINIENRTFFINSDHTQIRGDVNRNNLLDTGDATLILRYVSELSIPSEYMPILSIGDINCNGIIDTGDATLILRYVAGLDLSRCQK